jgi:hypothetical protein
MLDPMKTTIEIQSELLRKAKETARKEGTTLRALVEEGLRSVLGSRGKPRRKRKFRMRTFRGNGLQPGIDFSNWEQMRSIIYEGHGG